MTLRQEPFAGRTAAKLRDERKRLRATERLLTGGALVTQIQVEDCAGGFEGKKQGAVRRGEAGGSRCFAPFETIMI